MYIMTKQLFLANDFALDTNKVVSYVCVLVATFDAFRRFQKRTGCNIIQ